MEHHGYTNWSTLSVVFNYGNSVTRHVLVPTIYNQDSQQHQFASISFNFSQQNKTKQKVVNIWVLADI